MQQNTTEKEYEHKPEMKITILANRATRIAYLQKQTSQLEPMDTREVF